MNWKANQGGDSSRREQESGVEKENGNQAEISKSTAKKISIPQSLATTYAPLYDRYSTSSRLSQPNLDDSSPIDPNFNQMQLSLSSSSAAVPPIVAISEETPNHSSRSSGSRAALTTPPKSTLTRNYSRPTRAERAEDVYLPIRSSSLSPSPSINSINPSDSPASRNSGFIYTPDSSPEIGYSRKFGRGGSMESVRSNSVSKKVLNFFSKKRDSTLEFQSGGDESAGLVDTHIPSRSFSLLKALPVVGEKKEEIKLKSVVTNTPTIFSNSTLPSHNKTNSIDSNYSLYSLPAENGVTKIPRTRM